MDDEGLQSRVTPGYPLTLVLGAGVSSCRGLPQWAELLRRAWQVVFRDDPFAREDALLGRAREASLREGLPAGFVERLSLARHPLELQFGFEQVLDALRWMVDDKDVRTRLGLRRRSVKRPLQPGHEARTNELFADLLRKLLYEGRRRGGSDARAEDTLSLVVKAVLRSARTPANKRLISQVITFNVDDLLEREVNENCRRRVPYAIPIARASANRPLPSRQAIPVFHLHGFLPKKSAAYPFLTEDGLIVDAPPPVESLVFTDEQYWRTVGNPAGFASRVFCSALAGCCVFIGLSMTDLNIIRWLAQDAIERTDDFRRMTFAWGDPLEVEFNVAEERGRHYWLTTAPRTDAERGGEARAQMLRRTLDLRGVRSIDIPSWDSPEFHAWWKRCFLTGSA